MREIRKKENKIIQLKEAFFNNRNELELTGEESSERSGMNRPCITESCLGFLDGKGLCPICKKITCLTCNIQKVENEVHECKDSDKAMWIEIRNTTKPCPSCRVRIFKISGCDQMWCIHCNTGFSWSRGTIEKGPIHNPHYFDWLFEGGAQRQTNRQVDYCNDRELPPEQNLSTAMFDEFRDEYRTTHPEINSQSHLWSEFKKTLRRKVIFDIYRILRHIQFVEIPSLQQNDYQYRRGLYQYLVGILQKKDCKKLIEQYDYKRICNREMSEIISGFLREVIYIFNAYMRTEEMSMDDILRDIRQYTSMYSTGIQRFEKEYKRSYSKYARYLAEIDQKIHHGLKNNHLRLRS
jgi:hypothetical protein